MREKASLASKLKCFVRDFNFGYIEEKAIREHIISEGGMFLYEYTNKIYEFSSMCEKRTPIKIGHIFYCLFNPVKTEVSRGIILDYLLSHPGLLTKS